MAKYAADLHVHSRFSRASSPQMSLPNLILWARRKGIDLLGTGDFTHPQWLEEIEEYLEPEGSGFLKAREDLDLRFLLTQVFESVHFIDGRKYQIHLLVTAPGLDAVISLTDKLSGLTDFASDQIPQFRMSAEELTERILEASPRSLIVPTHIFTPSSSLYGSEFGYDCMETCFGKMASEIGAVETGLSTDPGICWRISGLDSQQLVSFSDAHSLRNLGRESTLFEGEFSYEGLSQALKSSGSTRIAGTVEYCSELGKYYFNGHRACKIVRSPVETRFEGKRCPACRKEITIGAFHRALEIADREAEDLDVDQERGWIHARRLRRPPYRKMIPLHEIIASAYGIKGRESRTVERIYDEALSCGATERQILLEMTEADLRALVDQQVTEGIIRVRESRYKITPGYDGGYGQLEIFGEHETADLMQMKLFEWFYD